MKEYGGYLPLETGTGPDLFSQYGEERVLRTNSAKAAIYFALRQSGIQKLYLPHYMCRSVKVMLAETGIDVQHYFLRRNLLPELDKVEKSAAVLLVNYFGIMEEAVRQEAGKYEQVLIDQSHGFFARPVMREGTFNIYSCRKFVGVPDGGCLVGENLPQTAEPEPDQVSGYFQYLVTSFEQGTNAAYQEKMASDRYFLGNYKGMSVLTRRMLASVDYEGIRQKRAENFHYLNSLLGGLNRIEIPEEYAPAYVYPFLAEKGAAGALKSALVSERIYVPTLWRELIDDRYAGTWERELSESAVFLPVDQRYGKEDMEYLAERVKRLLEGLK